MAKRPTKKKTEVSNYAHGGSTRRNIPTAELQGFVAEDEARPRKLRYKRDPDRDPQLVWRGKDAEDEADLYVDAPPVYIQEKVHPRQIIERLRRDTRERRGAAADMPDLFADFDGLPEDLEARTEFYAHDRNWQNRMILGDSLMVMASLAEREGLRGRVQCVYMDPPYGIRFNSNWQASTGSRDVRDGRREHISREPEVVRAFRDTWRDGVHSYLSYLRDRLVLARDLLADSGSVFVQIGDENVHRVRALMDEVFGEENYVAQITVRVKSPLAVSDLARTTDFLIWYSKSKASLKFRKPLIEKRFDQHPEFSLAMTDFGETVAKRQIVGKSGSYRYFTAQNLASSGYTQSCMYKYEIHGKIYDYPKGKSWKTHKNGMIRLDKAGRLHPLKTSLRWRYFYDDAPSEVISDVWSDTFAATDKVYVVQTSEKVVQRCILMTTDPGDLVIDPTCGSGTTAHVAEQWGRRWITIDTSRVALALARARIMGGRHPWYLLADSAEGREKAAEIEGRVPDPSLPPPRRDIRQGFVCERVPHITLKSIANNAEIDVIWEKFQKTLEPLRARLDAALGRAWEEWEVPREAGDGWPEDAVAVHAEWWQERIARQREIDASIARAADYETLHDKPYEDRDVVRVAGPFTVESLSPHRVVPSGEDPELLEMLRGEDGELPRRVAPREETDFARVVVEHLRVAGVRNTKKGERLVFDGIEPWPGRGYVAFEGRYEERGIARRAAIAIGPEWEAVGYEFVRRAANEARDAFDILVVCGFQFAPEVDDSILNLGRLRVLKARMNQDIRMGERLKNTGASNLFVVFGEPDARVRDAGGGMVQVEIAGVDIFDPTTGETRSSGDPAEDIACWLVDDDYDEESFFVRQAYFLGGAGGGDPYKALKRALKAEIDEEAWASLRTAVSRPFPRPKSGRVCVKVINHYGDEAMKAFRV